MIPQKNFDTTRHARLPGRLEHSCMAPTGQAVHAAVQQDSSRCSEGEGGGQMASPVNMWQEN